MEPINKKDLLEFSKTVKPGDKVFASYTKRVIENNEWTYKKRTEFVEVKASYPFFCLTIDNIAIPWIDIYKLKQYNLLI